MVCLEFATKALGSGEDCGSVNSWSVMDAEVRLVLGDWHLLLHNHWLMHSCVAVMSSHIREDAHHGHYNLTPNTADYTHVSAHSPPPCDIFHIVDLSKLHDRVYKGRSVLSAEPYLLFLTVYLLNAVFPTEMQPF